MERVEEFWAVCGRRAGKTRAAATLAVYLAALVDHSANLVVGERGLVLLVAENKEQAGIVFNYIAGIFDSVPLLSALVMNRTADTLALSNGVDLEVRAASFKGLRGVTAIAIIADELAFFASEGGNTDSEILAAVRPSLSTTSGLLVGVSSPYGKRGSVGKLTSETSAREVIRASWSRQARRGTSTQACRRGSLTGRWSVIRQRRAASTSGYFGTIFPAADLALIEAAVDRGVTVRPPRPGVFYSSFCDPSGGAKDLFTAAIAHSEGGNNGVVVLDCLLEIKAPFNPDTAVLRVAAMLKSYGLTKTVSDKYAAAWPVAAFARNGIALQHSERDRSQIYLNALPFFTTGRVRLLDDQRLVTQFAGLERTTSPIGKDRIDHGRNGQDDSCNAAAGALVLAATQAAPFTVTPEFLARAAAMVPTRRNFGSSRGGCQMRNWN